MSGSFGLELSAPVFTPLEIAVMEALLKGDSPLLAVLRQQWTAASLDTRELTGVGFYTNFSVPPDVPRLENRDLRIGDVLAEITGLRHGAGFILWVKHGTLAFLEGYSFGEDWPSTVDSFSLRYEKGEPRNLPDLGQ